METIIRQLAAIKSSLDWIGILLGSIIGMIIAGAIIFTGDR
jgi:hypothetical protein